MNTENELPEDVIDAIRANKKIAAIKQLRSARAIGLKEAKELVEAYIDDHPQALDTNYRAPSAESGVGRLLVAIIVAGMLYAAYRYFS